MLLCLVRVLLENWQIANTNTQLFRGMTGECVESSKEMRMEILSLGNLLHTYFGFACSHSSGFRQQHTRIRFLSSHYADVFRTHHRLTNALIIWLYRVVEQTGFVFSGAYRNRVSKPFVFLLYYLLYVFMSPCESITDFQNVNRQTNLYINIMCNVVLCIHNTYNICILFSVSCVLRNGVCRHQSSCLM